jgi:hypothetical protein
MPVKIHGIKGKGVKEDFKDPYIFILISFVPVLLKSFNKIIVIYNKIIF